MPAGGSQRPEGKASVLWESLFLIISIKNSRSHRLLLKQALMSTLSPHLPQLHARALCSPSGRADADPSLFRGGRGPRVAAAASPGCSACREGDFSRVVTWGEPPRAQQGPGSQRGRFRICKNILNTPSPLTALSRCLDV